MSLVIKPRTLLLCLKCFQNIFLPKSETEYFSPPNVLPEIFSPTPSPLEVKWMVSKIHIFITYISNSFYVKHALWNYKIKIIWNVSHILCSSVDKSTRDSISIRGAVRGSIDILVELPIFTSWTPMLARVGSILSFVSMRLGCLVPVDWRWFI